MQLVRRNSAVENFDGHHNWQFLLKPNTTPHIFRFSIFASAFLVFTTKMPLENLEDQGLEKNPNLELAQYKFLLTLPEFKQDRTVHQKISDAIKKEGEFANIFKYIIETCLTCS